MLRRARRWQGRWGLICWLLLVPLGGCAVGGCAPGGGSGPSPEEGPEAAADSRQGPLNVVLISIDTLRPDHLSCYGYSRSTSPYIDQFAATGVLFEETVSTTAWTLPGHASMLSGLSPRRHGALRRDLAIRPSAKLLAEYLDELGYFSTAVVDAPFVQASYGFDRGFDHYLWDKEAGRYQHQQSVLAALQQAHDLYRKEARPFFAFFHYMSVHSPYRPEPEFDVFRTPGAEEGSSLDGRNLSRLRKKLEAGEITLSPLDVARLVDLYDGEILSMDERMGELFRRIQELDLEESTVVVLTADHGEEFYEHGNILHNRTLYEEVLRVPLIVRGPGIPAERRVTALTSLVDVTPTLLQLVGAPSPSGLDGISLVRFWRDDARPRRELELATSAPDGSHAKIGMRTAGEKLQIDRENSLRELYDLIEDPGETKNLAPEDPRTQELEDLLVKEIWSEGSGEVELSSEDEEILRSLGYL
ncbi:MAG: sulfatase [Acidobacteriota bacterium]